MLSIVIPAYNEEKRIADTLHFLRLKFPSSNIIVVFDGNDKTPDIAKKFGAFVYVNGARLGKGASIKLGLSIAKSNKILIIDADLPTDEVEKIITQDADLVIAHRDLSTMPRIRRFLHHGYNFLAKLLFPSLIRFKDLQAGVKLVKKEVTERIMDELIMNDFVFDTNLIYAFVRHGFKVKEVHVKYNHKEEDSKISGKLVKIVIFMALSLIKLRVYYSPFRRILYTKTFLKIQDKIIKMLR
ncbi:MAG: glycosyltransferase [Sulfolobus sp.]|nr:glycosyltransferase [Sulfolobus sp.]